MTNDSAVKTNDTRAAMLVRAGELVAALGSSRCCCLRRGVFSLTFAFSNAPSCGCAGGQYHSLLDLLTMLFMCVRVRVRARVRACVRVLVRGRMCVRVRARVCVFV